MGEMNQSGFYGPAVDHATLTHLLGCWSQGDREVAERLMPKVYGELRRIAHRVFQGERSDHTLQATALVHEVYLELNDHQGADWPSREHFFGFAACLMRRALIDHGRERCAQKRGGGLEQMPLEKAERIGANRPKAYAALDDAMQELARLDPRKALIVELRFYGGLTVDEAARCLELSPRTVAREWRLARAALYREMCPEVRGAF